MQYHEPHQTLKICKASAGSGKTFTLVLEYLTIALSDKEGKKYKKILAVTFTNMAANEMKERIIEELKHLAYGTFQNQGYLKELKLRLSISEEEIQARASKTMSGVLHDYSDFSVMTIDKFVHRITRAFSRELDITPDFDIEIDESEVKERISAELLEQAGNDQEVTQLLKQALLLRVENNKNWNLKNDLEEYASLLFKEGMNQKIENLPNYSVDDLIKCRDLLQGEIVKYEKHLQSKIAALEESVKNAGYSFNDFANSLGNKLQKLLDGNQELMKADDFNTKNYWVDAQGGIFFTKEKQSKAENEISNHLEKWKELMKEINDWVSGPPYEAYIDHQVMRNNIFLTGVLSKLKNVADQIRKDDNFLMISDFYRLITELILKEPVAYIYEKLGNRYEHFLIDEFQDTSVLQWLNFIPMLENSLSQGYSNFIVGDIKQSIYRFRNGEVEQFKALPKLYNPTQNKYIQEKEVSFVNNENLLELDTNRRSSPEIVKFNNGFFKQLVEQNEKYQPLSGYYENVVQKPFHEKPIGFVKWYDFSNKKDFDDIDQKEMEIIEENIQNSLKKGYSYKDICVLNRKNKHGIRIANYLIQAGIPVISQESLQIQSHPSSKAVVYYLELILNPKDRQTMSLFLENYFRMHPEKMDLIDWSKMVFNKSQDASEKSSHILSKLGLPSSYDEFKSYSLYRLVEKVMLSLDLKVDGNPYLHFLLHQTFEFSSKFNGNPDLFIDWFWEKGGKKSIKIPDSIDAVQITSIHKSKGLQYKIVIVPQTKFKQDRSPDIKDVKETGFSDVPDLLMNIKKNGKWKHEYEEEELKNLLDNLNIYYVAFTRAEHQLIVINHDKSINATIELMQGRSQEDNNGISSYEWGENQPINIKDERSSMDAKKEVSLHAFRDEEIPSFAHFTPLSETGNEVKEKMDEGKTLHELLSKIANKSDWEKQVLSFYNKGKIDDLTLWKDKVDSVLNDEQLAIFYPISGQIIMERGIINEKGQRKIPDRVVQTDEKTLILDFKTGMPNKGHQKQVKEYINLIASVEGTQVEGYLYYTGLKRLDRVS